MFALTVALILTMTACFDSAGVTNTADEVLAGTEISEPQETAASLYGCADTSTESNESHQRVFNNLLRTGEFLTAEQMETLKAQASSWQHAFAGMGSFAHIVALEHSDDSNQEVFISFGGWIDGSPVFEQYEKIQIQVSCGTQVRIIGAAAGAGSGELDLAFRFITDDSEWVEVFFVTADGLYENGAAPLQWPNITCALEDEALQWFSDGEQFMFDNLARTNPPELCGTQNRLSHSA
jgi:hypothetical protein